MPDTSRSPWWDANRKAWARRAALHVADGTGFYDVAGFLGGGEALYPIEAAEIGNVTGLRIAHLQCHFGLDTLSLARRGADVTGLDFAPEAIGAARDLAARAGLAARFVEADVYEAREVLEGAFDLVYATWGTIVWLPDVRRWARTVASLLGPSGALYFADLHPSALVLDEREGRLQPSYGWRTPADRPDRFVETASYTGDAFSTPVEEFCWIHPLSDIIGGLLDAGMAIEFLHEHERIPSRLFPSMVPGADRMYRLPDGAVPIPLAVSIRATKR
ncbi:class I SAM-dependent methyltransferase [Salinarimonas sp. NSM]|uniref:class I SAM-dependent methyltransferase n=1 Tax=Salinarimonas sp. NSM TaxID=3458003 RepID=UPI0040361355